MNSNWLRWIYASIGEHFKTNLSPLKVVLELEDDQRITEADDGVEVRIQGPFVKTTVNKESRLKYSVSLLLKLNRDPKDIFKIPTQQGIVLNAFKNICIYKFGKAEGDDRSYLETLVLKTPQSGLTVDFFRPLNSKLMRAYATIGGLFEISLKE